MTPVLCLQLGARKAMRAPSCKQRTWDSIMFRISTLLLTGFTLCSLTIAMQPGKPFKPGKLSPAEVAALTPGLTLRFYAKANDAKPVDARRIRLAALHVP